MAFAGTSRIDLRILSATSSPTHNAWIGTADILKGLDLKDRTDLRKRYLGPAMQAGLIEMTMPDTPNDRRQKYRLTALGQAAF